MPPLAALERLAAAAINLIPLDLEGYYVFERDGFIALVQRRRDDAFGHIGAAGLATETGLAPLVWRGNTAVFARRTTGDTLATSEQIETLRRFQADLETAIRG